MSGIVVKFTCPKCSERHVTWECPACARSRARAQPPRIGIGFYHVTPTTRRRDAIADLIAEYIAAHPGATVANTSMLDVSLWLASRNDEALAAE